MIRIRQVFIHCAYIAALIDVGACSSEDGLAASSEVQASGEGQSLFFNQHHEKKKKKHHWDDCDADADAGTAACQSLALHVDSIKHREDTQKADGTINVRVPETLSSYFWGKRLEAQLTLQQKDGKRVVCTYTARRHRFGGVTSSLELDSCDHAAKAGDSVAIDSATLKLDCSRPFPFAKVWVELPEIEPCGEPPVTPECDPATLDDHNPCTRDSCGANGPQHEPLAQGTACADDTVCNGDETCNGQGTCQKGDAPTPPQTGVCQTRMCDPQTGWALLPKPVGTLCADADVCNGPETCTANGTCGSGDPLDTDDHNMCTDDDCDPISGVSHTPIVVTDNDLCMTIACDPDNGITSTPINADDGKECTVDACDPVLGVTHVAKPDLTPCMNNTRSCVGGVCMLVPG